MESFREGTSPALSGENEDWCRWCSGPLTGEDESGEDIMVDFDLEWLGVGPGEGEGEALALLKGCARHRGPFCAGTLMAEVQNGACKHGSLD